MYQRSCTSSIVDQFGLSLSELYNAATSLELPRHLLVRLATDTAVDTSYRQARMRLYILKELY